MGERACLPLIEVSKASTSLAAIRLDFVGSASTGAKALSFRQPPGVALLLRTSGTTGIPKLVPVTHGNLLEMAIKMERWLGLSSDDRTACLLPTYYAQGCKTAILIPILLGGSTVVPATRWTQDFIAGVSDWRLTWLSAGPTLLQNALGRLQDGRALPKHCLRFVLSSSSHLPEPVRSELEQALKVPILEFYGLSEAGMMAVNPPPPAKRKPGTAGVISPGELIIRGKNGDALPSSEVGEIFVRGPSVMPGYLYEADAATSGPHEGWLATGDLGRLTPTGSSPS